MEWNELEVYLEKYRSVFKEDFPLMMAHGIDERKVIEKCIATETKASVLYPKIFGARIGEEV